MASTPGTFYGNTAAVRQDLSGVLPIITKGMTPLLTKISNAGKATSRTVEWVADTVTFPTANNAKVEGADVEPASASFGSRATNWTQILEANFAISDTIGEAGSNLKMTVADAYMAQKEKGMKTLALSLEYALVNATGNSGAASTAPEMKGLAAWATANTADIVASAFTASGKASSTGEGQFKSVLTKLYNNGVRPDFAYMSIDRKNDIYNWKGRSTNNDMDVNKKEINDIVTLYRTDEGVIEFLDNISSCVSTASVYVGRIADNMEVKYLRRAKIKQLGKAGDNERYIITQECTLGVDNPSSVGVLSLT